MILPSLQVYLDDPNYNAKIKIMEYWRLCTFLPKFAPLPNLYCDLGYLNMQTEIMRTWDIEFCFKTPTMWKTLQYNHT